MGDYFPAQVSIATVLAPQAYGSLTVLYDALFAHLLFCPTVLISIPHESYQKVKNFSAPENKPEIISLRNSTEIKNFCFSENNDGSPEIYSETYSFQIVISTAEILYLPV